MKQGLQLTRKASATVGVFKTSSNETRPAVECARPYNKHCPMKQGLQLVRKASATVGGTGGLATPEPPEALTGLCRAFIQQLPI